MSPFVCVRASECVCVRGRAWASGVCSALVNSVEVERQSGVESRHALSTSSHDTELLAPHIHVVCRSQIPQPISALVGHRRLKVETPSSWVGLGFRV